MWSGSSISQSDDSQYLDISGPQTWKLSCNDRSLSSHMEMRKDASKASILREGLVG